MLLVEEHFFYNCCPTYETFNFAEIISDTLECQNSQWIIWLRMLVKCGVSSCVQILQTLVKLTFETISMQNQLD